MNPNVEVTEPKIIEIRKAAIKLPQYDKIREGIDVKDLLEPAPCLENDMFDPSLAYIPLIRKKPFKPKKKRGENEIKLFDFVDSSKAIAGSSDEEEEQRRGAKRKFRGVEPLKEDENVDEKELNDEELKEGE